MFIHKHAGKCYEGIELYETSSKSWMNPTAFSSRFTFLKQDTKSCSEVLVECVKKCIFFRVPHKVHKLIEFPYGGEATYITFEN